MKIVGKKYLENNTYNSVKIDISNNNYLVEYKGNSGGANNVQDKITAGFSRTFDDEIIVKLVNHFLLNNMINYVNKHEYVKWQRKSYFTARSNQKTLMIKLTNGILSMDIRNRIYNKYFINRDEYYSSGDVLLKLIFKSNDYMKFGDELCFMVNDNNALNNIDIIFLTELIYSRFDYKNKAYISKIDCINNIKDIHSGIYLICGDEKIEIDNYFVNLIEKIVEEYNNELLNDKKIK